MRQLSKMKIRFEYDERKTLYEKVKLSSEEIRSIAPFSKITEEQLDRLQETVFNLSLVIVKLKANESA